MNQCVISGHLTRDPELRYTQTGVPGDFNMLEDVDSELPF